MPDSTNTQRAPLIERARKVLQYEQRGNHQDRIVKGGLELFVVRWADEVSAICKKAGLDLKPIYRFTENLEGYRRQDPMQRASSLRSALAVLNELEQSGTGNNKVIRPETSNTGKVSLDITESPSLKDDLKEVKTEFREDKLLSNGHPTDKSGKTKGAGSPQQSPKSLDSHQGESIRLEAG